MTNNAWSEDIKTVQKHCLPHVELLQLKRQPFNQPREFSAVVLATVYIPPHANATAALDILHEVISGQKTAYPDTVFMTLPTVTYERCCKKNANIGTLPQEEGIHWSMYTATLEMLIKPYPAPTSG